jgi:hypothetical protein
MQGFSHAMNLICTTIVVDAHVANFIWNLDISF